MSVIVPFAGDREGAAATLKGLTRLRLGSEDELIIVDNSEQGAVVAAGSELHDEARVGSRVLRAIEMRSSYYARNLGAEHAHGDWLLFIDADCRPAPSLLDDYFREPVPPDCGAVSGAVVFPDSSGWLEAWAVSRGVLDQGRMFRNSHLPAAVTANLLVRRSAWASVGGFMEGIRSGGDSDFCWRLQSSGWRLTHRPAATIEHRHRGSLRELASQMARYGAGAAWLNRRHPGSSRRPAPIRGLARCAAGVIVWPLLGRLRRGLFKAIDSVAIAATAIGYLRGNGAPRGGLGEIGVLVDSYPKLSETFVSNEVAELARRGALVRVEGITRPDRPSIGATRSTPVTYVEDQGIAHRLASLVWLIARHPLQFVTELPSRRRWDADDYVSLTALAPIARRLASSRARHLHAHFATASSVSAQRLSRLLDVPFSVTVHGFEIWQQPRRLREKLFPAAFVTSGCSYNVDHIRGLVRGREAPPVHELIMGVDPERFRRHAEPPDDGTVAAVGRLVEKKGFRFLISATAKVEAALVRRVVIVGDGSLRSELESFAEEAGVAERIEFRGGLGPEGVREVLESSDLLAAPYIVAADGDRDSMPVVVKEAMAMEVPVVASEEVGIPEAVESDRGRLVPPGDPDALARALSELLRLPAAERAGMGATGREWVLQNATLESQASKLLELIDAQSVAVGPGGAG